MIFTLGHSTLEPDEFIRAARGIDVIVDVRSHPGSRHVPHFNRDEMKYWLPLAGIDYEWWPALGGWDVRHATNQLLVDQARERGVDLRAYGRGVFPKQRIGVDRPADQPNPTEAPGEAPRPTWTNQGLYDYAWYTALIEFLEGVNRLINRFGRPDVNCAIVCCEACWWKCHRSMIADHLVWRGHEAFHLPVKPPKRETTPRFKPHSAAIGNRLERYPVEVLDAWVCHCGANRRALTAERKPATVVT